MQRLKRIEMFRAGVMNDGRTIDAAFIDSLVESTAKAMAEGFVPKVKVGRNHDAAEIRGTIDALYREGESLYGDISVQDGVVEGLRAGEIPDDRSVELGYRFYLASGEVLPAVLTGLVIGIDVPASHVLDPIEPESGGREWAFDTFARLDVQEVRTEAFASELVAAEAAALRPGLTDDNALSLRDRFGRLRTAYARMDAELRASQAETERLRAEIFGHEAADRERYVDGLVAEGKILPAAKKAVASLVEALARTLPAPDIERLIGETFRREGGVHTSLVLPAAQEVPAESGEHIDPTNHSGGNE